MHVATQQIQAEMGWPRGRGLLRMESGAEMRLEAWGHRRGFGLPCICQQPRSSCSGEPRTDSPLHLQTAAGFCPPPTWPAFLPDPTGIAQPGAPVLHLQKPCLSAL